MPKSKNPRQVSKQTQGQEAGSITFSTRFTEEQRDRIAAAAEVRGWSPSNLMRVSTLERSANILNTTRQTRLDFAGIAARVARQLMEPEIDSDADPGSPRFLQGMEAVDQFGLNSSSLRMEEVQVLKNAARLAGGELLNMIIEACERKLSPDRKDLPEPIEPM